MENIGFIGYLLASIAFVVFILLLIAARNSTLKGHLLLLASVATLASSAVSLLQLEQLFSLKPILMLDVLKLTLWSVLILSTRDNEQSSIAVIKNKSIQQYLILSGVSSVIIFGYSYINLLAVKYVYILFLVMNLWLLILIEQLFRNAVDKFKRALWPLVIALGTMAVFDFIVFSQATLLNQLSTELWYLRGFVTVFSVPFLLIAARRIKNWSVNVFVSRHVVFYSTMLLISGVYLLIMSLAGYVINYLGGEWGKSLSILFLFIGGVVLAGLLITEKLRLEVKVFITKNFFANKYEYRDEWLDLISKIETTSAESHYQMATQIMMAKLKVEGGALIKKITSNHFQIKYSEEIDLVDSVYAQLPSLSVFCHKKGWIVDIKEYQRMPSMYGDLVLNIDAFIKQNIGIVIPIFIGKAFYGLFLLSPTHRALNWEDRDLLFAVSKQLGNFITLHEATDKIAESKQFDAFNRMSAFLVHDLKNVQAQLTLINQNAVKHRNNPEFIDDVFETVESATNRLEKMLTQLRNKQVAQTKSKVVAIHQVIDKVVTQCNIRQPQIIFDYQDECELSVDDETLYSVLNHLLQNAQEATAADGWVKISLTDDTVDVVITIEDNGCGMSADFIKNRLYKPFDTTKGNAGMGIGVFEAKQFFEGNAGVLDVSSVEGQGTKFTMKLPKNRSF